MFFKKKDKETNDSQNPIDEQDNLSGVQINLADAPVIHGEANDLLSNGSFVEARNKYISVVDAVESSTNPSSEILFLRDNCYYRIWESYIGEGKLEKGLSFLVNRNFKYLTPDVKDLIMQVGDELLHKQFFDKLVHTL